MSTDTDANRDFNAEDHTLWLHKARIPQSTHPYAVAFPIDYYREGGRARFVAVVFNDERTRNTMRYMRGYLGVLSDMSGLEEPTVGAAVRVALIRITPEKRAARSSEYVEHIYKREPVAYLDYTTYRAAVVKYDHKPAPSSFEMFLEYAPSSSKHVRVNVRPYNAHYRLSQAMRTTPLMLDEQANVVLNYKDFAEVSFVSTYANLSTGGR